MGRKEPASSQSPACQVFKAVSSAQARPKLWLLTRLSLGKGIVTLLVYKQSMHQKSQHHLGMCQQFWISGPTSTLLKHNLHFNKLLGQLICISKLEKYEFQHRNFHLHARYLPFTSPPCSLPEMLNSTDLNHRAPMLSGCWFTLANEKPLAGDQRMEGRGTRPVSDWLSPSPLLTCLEAQTKEVWFALSNICCWGFNFLPQELPAFMYY